MTSIEQHKIIAELREHEAKMTRRELEAFTMYAKRDTDDEDLDELSKKALLAMHAKSEGAPAPRANPLDALFKEALPRRGSAQALRITARFATFACCIAQRIRQRKGNP
ncbi:MAG: hypothetical protein IPP94_11535 [Ignavibacteria bacterium]|nr:hypothetical protein [Ignavibacteria bacterium]